MRMHERLEVEKVRVNGMIMYKVENELFLTRSDAECHANGRARYGYDCGTLSVNYKTLSYGYSELEDDDFFRMLRTGMIHGILL